MDTGRGKHRLGPVGGRVGGGRVLGKIANACWSQYLGDGLIGVTYLGDGLIGATTTMSHIYLCNKTVHPAHVPQN